jgi:hypothetical protein
MPSFSENLLISIISEKLISEPGQIMDVRRGMAAAMEGTLNEATRLEKLAETLEKLTLPDAVAVMNLWKSPLEPLWMRAAVAGVKSKLLAQAEARLVIVGLWHNICPSGKRTAASYRSFGYWQGFIESLLTQTNWKNLEVVWVG